MNKERKRMILALIGTALDVEGDEVDCDERLKQLVTQYGGRSGVTCDEVEEVLDTKVRDILL